MFMKNVNKLFRHAFVLILGVIIADVNADTQTISTAVTANYVIADGDGLEVTENGSIIVSGDDAVENAGAVTSITNDGIISTDTDGTDAVYIDGSVSGNITNNGTISNTNSDSSNDSAIEINQGNVTGSIINNGTITSAADNGIAVWGASNYDPNDGLGVVTGGIINNSTITGYNEALDLDDGARIDNGITNNGTIIGQNDDAIEIDEGALVNGGILNNSGATIKSLGSDAIAIEDSAVVSGGITNYGTIDGVDSGIYIEDATLNDGIINHGIIQSEDSAIYLYDEAVLNGGITNYGTIKSTNDDYAIWLYDEAVLNGGITNYGSIIGYDEGIEIYDNSDFNGDIKNYGTIYGRDYSIWIEDNVDFVGAIYNYEGGTIAGTVDIDSTGSIDLTNSGLLALKKNISLNSVSGSGQPDSSALVGNYIQTSTGRLHLAIDDAATGAGTGYSNLDVTGNVTFPSEAKIELDVKNDGANISEGERFENVVSASGTLFSSTFEVSDNLLSLNFSALNDGLGNIDLVASSTGITTIYQAVINTGNLPSVGSAAVLDNLLVGTGASADMQGVLDQFTNMSSIQEVADAVSQTLPLLTGSATPALGNALSGTNRVVQARLDGNRGLSSGDMALTDKHLWGKVYGSWYDQDDRKGVSGFDGDSQGLILGMDGDVNERTKLGLAVGYTRTSLDSNSRVAPNSADIDSYQLVGYGSYALEDASEISFQADLGWSNTEGSRTITFVSPTRVALSDYDSDSFHVGVGWGKTIENAQVGQLAPSVKLDYTYIESDSYTETGAGALNLSVDSNDVEALIVSADLKASHELDETTSLEGVVGVGYDLINEQAVISSSYVGGGSSFVVRGLDPDPLIGRLGFGLNKQLDSGAELNVRYDLEGREDYTNQTASVRLRWAF